MSNRTNLIAFLKGNLPSRFDVKDSVEIPDVLKKTTVWAQHRGYSHDANIRGVMDANFTVTVASHHKDRDKAEDALDQDLPDVLEQIDAAGLTWTTADAVLVADTYSGFNVVCSIPTPTPY